MLLVIHKQKGLHFAIFRLHNKIYTLKCVYVGVHSLLVCEYNSTRTSTRVLYAIFWVSIFNWYNTYMIHTHVGHGVRRSHLLRGREFCAHDLVLLPFLLTHALSVDGYEVETPTTILDIIHQLAGGKIDQRVYVHTHIHSHTHTCM